MNPDRPGVDLSTFFPAKVAKKKEDAVERREFLHVISSASFAATLGCCSRISCGRRIPHRRAAKRAT